MNGTYVIGEYDSISIFLTVPCLSPKGLYKLQNITFIIIILVLPPGVACPSNCARQMPGSADGDSISRCQVLGRAGSVHHGADQ